MGGCIVAWFAIIHLNIWNEMVPSRLCSLSLSLIQLEQQQLLLGTVPGRSAAILRLGPDDPPETQMEEPSSL